jgi:peptidyl-prolyl cis-trans isomerase B (cyclophilin B)
MGDGTANSHYWPQTASAIRTNPLAIAALVCGIAQFGYLFYKPLAVAAIAAIVLGHIAIRQIRRSGDGGYGLARAGLILGYIVLALGLIGVIVGLAIGASSPVVQSH